MSNWIVNLLQAAADFAIEIVILLISSFVIVWAVLAITQVVTKKSKTGKE